MGAVMAVVIMGYMWAMYQGLRMKQGMVAGHLLVFGISLLLVRSQDRVDDVSLMKAMIPHHSIAI